MSISQALQSPLIQAVAKYSPKIADFLGMPIAGTAITLLAHAFGISDPTPENVTAAIQSDPDAEMKIRQVELQNENLWASYDLQDKVDARAMAIAKTTNDTLMHIIAIVYLVGSLLYMGLQSAGIITKDAQIISYLQSVSMMILSFYYGGMYKQRRQVPKN